MYDPETREIFVGRGTEREAIKTRLADGERVLLLYGQPMVGKASLARQVAKDLLAENLALGKPPPLVHTVDCDGASDWSDVKQTICSTLSLDELITDEKLLLEAILQHARATGGKVFLLLLKMLCLDPRGHQMSALARFLNILAGYDVITIVTSRHRLHLPCKMEVKPLTNNDAMRLLSHHVQNFRPEDFEDIVKHCHGLPPLVQQVVQYVSGDPILAYTPRELTQLLEEDPGLLMRGLGKEAELLFAGLSPQVQGHVSTLAQLLDGTFSVEALQAALGVEGARAKTVLRHLWDESSVAIDEASSRMIRVHPILVHHVRRLGHVTVDDQARLRVVTLLGPALVRAEHELYLQDQDTVYGYVQGEWPQLQHVLRQAIHCTGDTYHTFLKVAFEAEKLLVRCFPEDATDFFRKMATAAVRFGTPRDQAMLQGLIGMAITQSQTMTGWKEAMDCFDRSLPIMRNDQRSPILSRLLCSIGSAHFRLSKLQESETYLKEALKVCEMTDAEDQHVIFQLIQIRSLLALPLIFKGQLAKAKELLLETLELCDSQPYKQHPHKPVLINSMGLFYERSGESQEEALGYYLKSLSERRLYMKIVPRELVPPLNNIGMQFCKRGFHTQAFQYLEEAEAIMGDTKHFSTALTQQHLGLLCLQSGDYERSERHFLKASRVYTEVTPKHEVHAKLALCLAHVYITSPCFDVSKVKEELTKACEISKEKGDVLSDASLLAALSAVEHRLQLDGWQVNRSRDLLDWALKRLRDYKGDKSNLLSEHQGILEDAAGLGLEPTDEQKETLTSRVIYRCQMCDALEREADVRDLWKQVEEETEKLRKVRNMLQRSDIIQDILQQEGEEAGLLERIEKVCLDKPQVQDESPPPPVATRGRTSSATQTEDETSQQFPAARLGTTISHSLSLPEGALSGLSDQTSNQGNSSSSSPQMQRQHSLGSNLLSQVREATAAGSSFIHCFQNQPVYNFHIHKFQGSMDLAASYSLASSQSDTSVGSDQNDSKSQSDSSVGTD